MQAILDGTPLVVGLAGFRGTPVAMDTLGKEIAHFASAATAFVRLVATADTDATLVQSIRNWIYPSHLLVELLMRSDEAEYEPQMRKMLEEMNSH